MDQPIAIFDIDGTLFRSSLAVELIYELVDQHIFPHRAQEAIQHDFIAWVNRHGTYERFIKQVIAVYEKHIRGCYQKDVIRISKKVVALHHQRVYRFTRKLIRTLAKQNYFLIALSGSPFEIVKAFNAYWPFNFSQGTRFDTNRHHRYTGTITMEPAKQKQTIIKQLIAQKKFSLRHSVGIGDTESDAGFLKLVEQPIAFNPNANLKKIAEQKHWRIVVERKDVIYEIQ